jgi:hypothetical protein
MGDPLPAARECQGGAGGHAQANESDEEVQAIQVMLNDPACHGWIRERCPKRL